MIVHEIHYKRPKKLKPIKQYIMSPSLAYIFGVMRGDGCAYITNSWFLRLNAKDEDFCREFARHLKIVEPNCSPCVYKLKNEKRGWISAVGNKSLYHAYINFDASTMLQATEQEKCLFIKGFYDSEGSCPNVSPRAVYCSSTNPDLLLLIQQLLSSLAIFSSLHKLQSRKYSRWQQAYHLIIHGRWNISIFHQKIGFTIKRKQDRLTNMCNNYLINNCGHSEEDYCSYLTFNAMGYTVGQICLITSLPKGAIDFWRYENGVPHSIRSKAYVWGLNKNEN
jgi:intein-encoded DNA endonuclease-like protein